MATTDEWVFGSEETSTQPTETTTAQEPTPKEPEAPVEKTDAKQEVEAKKSGSDEAKQKEPETPKAALSNDGDKRGAAFAKLRHKYEARVAKAERERDALRKEIESLKKEAQDSKSYIESSLIQRDIKNAERKLASIENPDEDWDESNELAVQAAADVLPETHLAEYKTRIAPYRSNLYKQLDSIAPKLSEYLKENFGTAAAIEMALASPNANQILQALNSSSYRECAKRCEAYAARLFPKQTLQPATQAQTEQTTVPTKPEKKVSTPSVTPKQTTDAKMSDIPDMATIASWF